MNNIIELKLFIQSYSRISDVDYRNVIWLMKCHRDKDEQRMPESWQTRYSRIMTCWELWKIARSK